MRTCTMMGSDDGAPCGKPARRAYRGQADEGCCDECFEAMIARGGFSRHEASVEYPWTWSREEAEAEFARIAEQLATQDNCSTYEPVYTVERHIREVGWDPDYSELIAWVDSANDDCVYPDRDPERHARLEAGYWDEGQKTKWRRRTGPARASAGAGSSCRLSSRGKRPRSTSSRRRTTSARHACTSSRPTATASGNGYASCCSAIG